MKFDITAFAKRVHRRMREHDLVHPYKRVPVTPVLSRILANDPDYLPYRERSPDRKRGPAKDPTISSVVAVAQMLGTTVGDLLGETPDVLTEADRAIVAGFFRFLGGFLRRQERSEEGMLPLAARIRSAVAGTLDQEAGADRIARAIDTAIIEALRDVPQVVYLDVLDELAGLVESERRAAGRVR